MKLILWVVGLSFTMISVNLTYRKKLILLRMSEPGSPPQLNWVDKMTYNSLLDQCIAISGWVKTAKAYYKKGRMQDGKHALEKALVIIDPIITELQKRPEIQEQDVWRDV